MFTVTRNGAVQCGLCHHNCRMQPGESGFCNTRKNDDGELALPYYGQYSAMALDPVEKKPFYHFQPGRKVFSIGYYGCNYRCPFCQNWQISQEFSPECPKPLSPLQLMELVKQKGHDLVCHTYSEPIIHFEYIYECTLLARQMGIQTLLVTNGSLEDEAAAMLYPLLDAVNIDLKSMSGHYYRNTLNGDLDKVLNNIDKAAANCHLEVTSLIIPGNNDSKESIQKAAGFLASVSSRHSRVIPWHLSRYFPHYRSGIPATEIETIDRLLNVARELLPYVYTGNVDRDSSTWCRHCSSLAVERSGYSVKTSYDTIKTQVRCRKCRDPLPIVESVNTENRS